MKAQTIPTVMTREDWEKEYLREYRQELREEFVSKCKGILAIVIGSCLVTKLIYVFATVIELITGNMSLF